MHTDTDPASRRVRTPTPDRHTHPHLGAGAKEGLAVATELADGLFTVNGQTRYAAQFGWAAIGVHGTVLADDEELDSPRVQAAAGPGNALAYHAAYEFGGDITTLPAGDVWLDTINQSPPPDRHLAVHDQHLIALNHADTAAWAAGSWKAIGKTTLTGSADEIGRRVNELAAPRYHRNHLPAHGARHRR